MFDKLESLSPEGDSGSLDGHDYTTKGGQTKILVTTRLIVSNWNMHQISAAI